MMRSKRGQFEVIGLAIIVILLALGILFVVQFVVNKPESQMKKTFTQTQLAANTLNAMLETTTHCDGLTMSELFQDCGKYKNSGTNLHKCSNTQPQKNSCEFITYTVDMLFNETLDLWGKEYYMFAVKDTPYIDKATTDQIIYEKQTTNCELEDVGESKQFPLPLHPGTLYVRIHLCG